MKKRLVIFAVIALAAALAIATHSPWLGNDRGTPVAQATTATVPRAPVVAPPPVQQIAKALHDDDPAGTLRLEGQVIDEHDQPVAGARVAIDTHPQVTAETETDGGFVFENLIARDYRLEATAGDDYAGPVRVHLGSRPEPATLRIRRGGLVEVAVTQAVGGGPISGAEVELRSTLVWHATTDASGIAKLRGVGAVWGPLAVRAAGFAPAAIMVSSRGDPGSRERVAVALVAGAPVSGRVIDDSGRPISGARVVAVAASEPFPVTDPRRDGVLSGSGGKFELPAIAAGTWRMIASHPSYGPATSAPLTFDGGHARSDIELVLAAGGVVRGVVRDPAGAPVAAVGVHVVVDGYLPWRARRDALTAADGSFVITGLARQSVSVVANHDRAASAVAHVDLTKQRDREVSLVLDITGTIEGTVVDRAGAPIGDARVVAEPALTAGPERQAWSVRGVQDTITDQGGAFRLAGLPDGVYRLRAARPGAAEAVIALGPAVEARPGDGRVRLTLPADGRITGKVAFADGSVPLRFAIAISDTAPRLFASEDGAFAMDSPGGNHRLTFTGPGFVQRRIEATVVEGDPTDLGTITVAAGRSISGRVLDESGAPVARATVVAGVILTGGGKDLYIPDESFGAKDTETDDAGGFSLDGFSPTALTVIAGKQRAGRSPSVRLPPGTGSVTLDLVLSVTTGLDGKITRGGAGLGDAVVIASPIGSLNASFFVTTGPDGTFAVDALAPGSYLVYPMVGGGGNGPRDMYALRADLTAGAVGHVEIDASPGPLTLVVVVKGASAAQVLAIAAVVDPHTMDELRDGSWAKLAAEPVAIHWRTATNGSAEIAGMRPGRYTVCAMATAQREDPGAAALACVPAMLGGDAAGRVEIVLPAPEKH